MQSLIPRKLLGDAREALKQLPDQSAQVCVTSPPYHGLRRYLRKGHPLGHLEIGCEPTFELYVEHLLEVFREVKRILRDDGSMWLNLGDRFTNGARQTFHSGGVNGQVKGQHDRMANLERPDDPVGLKPKDLCLIPARVAIALQNDGWYLRAMCPWIKRNCLSGGAFVYAWTQNGVSPMMLRDLVKLKPETVKLWDGNRWNQVTGFYRGGRPKSGLEIEIGTGERIGCTPDHVWPTERGELTSENLKVGDVLRSVKLPPNMLPNDPSGLPDEEIGWLVGLFIAEGYKSGAAIKFCGHVLETGDRLERLARLVRHFDGTIWTDAPVGKAQQIGIGGTVIPAIIDEYVYGNSSKNKCLKSAVWNRSDAFLNALILAYLSGDGHHDRTARRWRLGFCANDALARDIRCICARLGFKMHLARGKVTATKGGRFHSVWRGEIRTIYDDRSVKTQFKPKSPGRIVAIRRSRARSYWDVSLADPPHLFALASGVLTHNCVPESVQDRPASALEYFLLFSKDRHYFYDRYPVMMPVSGGAHPRSANGSRLLNENPPGQSQRRRHPSEFAWHGKGNALRPGVTPKSLENTPGSKQNESMQSSLVGMVTQRNRRNSDWFMDSWKKGVEEFLQSYQGMLTDEDGDPLAFVVNPRGTVLSHFAAYPPELVRPCILASTSEAGCCRQCGAPLVRLVEDGEADIEHQRLCGGDELGLYNGKSKKDYKGAKIQGGSELKRKILASMVEKKTVGWTFTCGHAPAQPVPCTVLDPFSGIGSTGQAATDLGRQYVGCDINEEYLKLSSARDGQGALSML